MVMREALQRSGASKGVLRAAGVGTTVSKASVPRVVGAADQMLKAAEKHAEAFRAAGLLPSDLEQLALLRASVADADTAQVETKASGAMKTAERNALGLRIQKAVEAIATAGLVQFHARPGVSARFRALIPSGGRRAKPATPSPA